MIKTQYFIFHPLHVQSTWSSIISEILDANREKKLQPKSEVQKTSDLHSSKACFWNTVGKTSHDKACWVLMRPVKQKMLTRCSTHAWTNECSSKETRMPRGERFPARIPIITYLQCFFQPPEGRNGILFFLNLSALNIMPKAFTKNKIKILHKWKEEEQGWCLLISGKGEVLTTGSQKPSCGWKLSKTTGCQGMDTDSYKLL